MIKFTGSTWVDTCFLVGKLSSVYGCSFKMQQWFGWDTVTSSWTRVGSQYHSLPPSLILKLASEYGDIVFLPSSDSSSSTLLRAKTHCISSSFLSEVRLLLHSLCLHNFLCFTIYILSGVSSKSNFDASETKKLSLLLW